MYRAKERGRNRLQLYNPTLNVRVLGADGAREHLRRALEQDQFQLHYQPQIELDSGRVVGVEALIRWQPPRARPGLAGRVHAARRGERA